MNNGTALNETCQTKQSCKAQAVAVGVTAMYLLILHSIFLGCGNLVCHCHFVLSPEGVCRSRWQRKERRPILSAELPTRHLAKKTHRF